MHHTGFSHEFFHMNRHIVLASGSEIRQRLLRNAGVAFEPMPVKVDEQAMRDAMVAEAAPPRDIADQLAEQKAVRAAQKHPGAVVIGCDQVLEFQSSVLSKPADRPELLRQLQAMTGKTHMLHSAAVIFENAQPVWRHVGTVNLQMRRSSAEYLEAYINRNWPEVGECVGGYKLEEEGVRLFHRIDGDYFNVLGLPLLEILSYLTLRRWIPG